MIKLFYLNSDNKIDVTDDYKTTQKISDSVFKLKGELLSTPDKFTTEAKQYLEYIFKDSDKRHCTHLVCTDHIPTEYGKLFFGDTGNFLRIDISKHPVFNTLRDIGYAGFWTWRKFDFSRDKQNWECLPDTAKRMFLLNNAYQSLMDSGVVSEYDYLVQLASNSELQLLYKYNSQNESIHAASYSYGLSKMFGAEAHEKINIVYEDRTVSERLSNEITFSDILRDVAHLNVENEFSKKVILVNIISMYALEAIKFPFSFFVTWRINEAYSQALQAFSMLLAEIAHDELVVHAPTHSNVIKILRKDASQGFSHLFDEFTDFVYNYIQHIVEQEIQWNKYLHSEGSIPGFSESTGEYFIKYMADRALTRAGFDKLYNVHENELIEWFDKYYKSNKRNIAAQEQNNINYQKGVLKDDILNNLDSLNELFNSEVKL